MIDTIRTRNLKAIEDLTYLAGGSEGTESEARYTVEELAADLGFDDLDGFRTFSDIHPSREDASPVPRWIEWHVRQAYEASCDFEAAKNDEQTCPRCRITFDPPHAALSRSDNTTYVCSPCGVAEATWQLLMNEPLPRLDQPVRP